MGAFGIWQWVVVLVIVLVLFGGRGKISALMGDFGKGLRSFKKGMKEDESASSDAPKTIDADATQASSATADQNKEKQSQD